MTVDYLVPWLNASGQGGLRNSMLVAAGDGVTTMYSINFAGGYIVKDNVKAYTFDPVTGTTTVLTITSGMWTGANQLTLTSPVPVGQYIVIYRDTPKGTPLVSFVDGAILNEPNLDLMAEQAVFIAAEMADRFDLLNDGSTLAIQNSATALSTANSAISQAAAAVVTANATIATANAAQAAAAAATATANDASTTAHGIDAKAQSALDASAAAVTTANAASTTANGIAGTAASAVSTANAANTTAGSAVTTANGAVTTANTAKSTADGLAASIATANTNAAAALVLANFGAVGQCRFVFVSSTQLRLVRFNGQYIIINGTPQIIPSGGVNLANTSLTISTLYYAYAYMNGATMTIEASTTAYATHTNGITIKTGDATRTLVGMFYVGSDGIFRDNPGADVHIASYFNRRRRHVQASVVAGGVVTATSPVLVGSATSMLVWKDEALRSSVQAVLSNTLTAQWVQVLNNWNNVNAGVSGWYQAFAANALGSATATAAVDTLANGGITSVTEGLIAFRTSFWVAGGQGNISSAAIYSESNT